MGREKTSTTQTQRAEMTPAERELQQIQLGQIREADPRQRQATAAGLDLVNLALTGQELPGTLAPLTTGIRSETIGQEATRLAREALPSFQALGIADSGVAFRETAEDIGKQLLFPAEQFNIGVIQNLLNQALTGTAQVQAPITAQTGQLGSSLQGLRTLTGTSTVSSPNPFLSSFQTSLGQSFGKKLGSGGFSLPKFGGN